MLHSIGHFSSVQDYNGADRVCDEMIGFFEQKNYTASVPLQIAYYQKLVCYLQLRRFDEEAFPIRRALALLEEGAFNWFKFQETYLVLALHTGQYERAYRIFQQSVAQTRFSKQPENLQEY